MGLRRHAGTHPPRAVRGLSHAGGARGQPNGGHPRQPERQERGKGSSAVDPSGYEAGKKVWGKKRYILVDTQGLLMHALVYPGSAQDRTGGVWVMASLFGLYPFLLRLYADGGYQGPAYKARLRGACRRLKLSIVKRFDQAKGKAKGQTSGFVVLPKRWIVERTFA